MQNVFRFFLASGRKRRRLMLGAALCLLRLLRDAENDEMWRNSDMLDSIGPLNEEGSLSKFNAVEEEYISCEHAISAFNSAIEELECAY